MYKVCSKCNMSKYTLLEFLERGLKCKMCVNVLARQSYRGNTSTQSKYKHFYSIKSRLAYATPCWVDIKAVESFYLACPEGYEVDHIIPLNSPTVQGLPCIANLQYLTPEDNRKKSNKYT